MSDRYHSPPHALLASLLTLVLLPLLLGCGSVAPLHTDESAYTSYIPSDVEHTLRAEASTWRGTPYRYGGTSRAGIDCSAFVQAIYRDAFGLSLPRATTKQVRTGTPVSKSAIQAGDLVFFRPVGRKTNHVGVYLGGGEFVHAATSTGVTLSRLNEPYWQRSYWTARRLLDDALPPAQTARRHPIRPPTRTPTRTGW